MPSTQSLGTEVLGDRNCSAGFELLGYLDP